MLASSVSTNNVLGIFASPAFFFDRFEMHKKMRQQRHITVIAEETEPPRTQAAANAALNT
jgi:hypothetical protein